MGTGGEGDALSEKKDLWFSTKDTIMKKYDGDFKETFQRLYDTEYKERFEAAGLEYFYTLIDDAVARVIRSHGGMIWALKCCPLRSAFNACLARFQAVCQIGSFLLFIPLMKPCPKYSPEL